MCDGDHVKYRSEKDSKDSGDHASFVQCDRNNHIQCCGDLFLQSAQPGYGRGYDYADRDQYGTYNFQHRNDTAALPGIRLDHQTGKKTPERGRRSSR